MEHTSRLSPCLALVAFFLLCSSPTSAASPRRLLESSVAQEFVVPHDHLRARLCLPPLRWSDDLAAYAASWAEQRKGDCALQHSDTQYGENIFWGAGARWVPSDAVAAWAEEAQYYDPASNTCRAEKDCTHYTQMMWRESTRIGCARIQCASGDTFMTCNYDPHGNVQGQKPF